jgi:ABC-type antimicrobial peptide transport system permease subunit
MVLGLVLREGLTLAIAGVIGGLLAFAAVGGFLRSFLFGISAGDPATLVVVAVAVLALATLASSVPALRAARISPLDALRGE